MLDASGASLFLDSEKREIQDILSNLSLAYFSSFISLLLHSYSSLIRKLVVNLDSAPI